MALDLTGGNPGDKSAKNIINVINAAADAHQAQTELQKQVMLKQIGDKMDLQKQDQEQIQKQNISFNMPGINDDSETPTGQTKGNGLSSNSGVATGATPSAVGDQPSLQGQPQASPMASVVNPAAPPSPTPMLNATAQPAPSPALNGVVPQVPQGVTIPSPIGKPLPPPQGKIIMGPDGKPMLNPNANSPDSMTYSQIYNKWKSGQTLSSGESSWIKNKFGNDEGGNPIKTPAVSGDVKSGSVTTASPSTTPTMDNYDKIRTKLENKLHMPSGSMWFNPSSNDGSGGWELNPIVKSRIEKEQSAQAAHDVRQPDIDFQQADQLDKLVNPTVAPTRSVLGLIGQTTVRAQRAIDQLSDPNNKITPQMLSGLGSDMAGILQGGAPTQVGMNEQQYNTLTSTLAKGVQYLSQNPQNALPPAIRQQLLDSFNQLNDTGKKYISNNIQSAEILHKDWVGRNQDKWNDLKDNISKQYGINNDSQIASNTPTIFNAKTGKTMTLSADGKSWQ